MADHDAIIAELRKTNAELLQRIAKLELQLAKALKNSSNSSKSPSSDIVKPPKKQAKRRKKAKRGGQKGHERKLREPLPPERVDVTIDYEIDDDEVERLKLTLTGEFETIQHIELPDVPVIVTEHRFPFYESPEGDVYYPYAPEVHGKPIFGPRLLATIGWMKSQAHSSYTTLAKYCDDVLGFSVSRGYLSKLCNGVISDSLSSAHEELRLAIPEQHQLGSDETSFKNNGAPSPGVKGIGSGASPPRCSLCFRLPAAVRGRFLKNWSVPTSRALFTSTTSQLTVRSPGTIA